MPSATAVVALLLILQLQILFCHGTKTFYFKKNKVDGRVKRAWTYPTINILENFIPPSAIATINSDDPRLDHYAIDTPTLNGADVFKIDSASGAITQLLSVDREQQDHFDVTAYAYGSGGTMIEDPVDLYINVFDANDNNPVFDADSLVGSVPENHVISSVINSFMTVTSTDQDIGNNAKVKYWIVENSESPPQSTPRFTINDVGKVFVNSALDYETDSVVTFQVVAKDGDPAKDVGNKVTATVTVNIQDSNDHPPVMDATPSRNLSELSPLDTPLYTVFASDLDEGVNKKAYFNIHDGNIGGKFDINSYPSDTEKKSRGEIVLVKPLDFESGTTSYDLVIVAYNKDADNADSSAYRATSTVSIQVTDANEPPIFNNVPYITTLSEATPDGTVLGVNVAVNDPDFGGNQTVVFSIASDPEFWFTIDSSSGQLRTNSLLDRESPNVVGSTYTFSIRGTDNYPGNPASADIDVEIFINDVNDNSPVLTVVGAGSDGIVTICEQPTNRTVTVIDGEDPDTTANGPPFSFAFDSEVDSNEWAFERLSAKSQMVVTFISNFDLSSNPSTYKLPFTVTDSGSPTQVTTSTLTVSICQCDGSGTVNCSGSIVGAGGFPLAVVIAIIVLFLIVIILVLSVIAYRRNQSVDKLKEPILYDEDDVRENIQVYHDEGGGEEDQEAYDLSTLRRPLMDSNEPIRFDEKPLQAQPQSRMPPGVSDDIGDYIGDAKDQADNDPSAPPFDSLLVFDYEGAGSDAGSLSSINTATTDGSMDYDYLNNWGPRFKRLADMYNDGSDSE